MKAAAARRAARRIVMRQVGDKLIPIGYTSSRAPATADFSMSTGAAGEEGSRRRRAGTGSNRERDLEEVRLDCLEYMRRIGTMSMKARPSASIEGIAHIAWQ